MVNLWLCCINFVSQTNLAEFGIGLDRAAEIFSGHVDRLLLDEGKMERVPARGGLSERLQRLGAARNARDARCKRGDLRGEPFALIQNEDTPASQTRRTGDLRQGVGRASFELDREPERRALALFALQTDLTAH